jgi:photosystem II stability/assembly factor-like uncharacterized protein
MKFTALASKAVLLVLLAAAVCVSAADTPTVTANPLANNVRHRVQMQAHSLSFSQTMEPFTGRSPTPRHRVGKTRGFCRLLETK